MCYEDYYEAGDFSRNRRCGRNRFVCDCREIRGSRNNRYDNCHCCDCRRRRREFVCRCWER